MSHWSWSVAVDPLVMLAVLGTVSAGCYELLKTTRRTAKKFDQFAEDWNGTDERPGVPRRPGVMERLELIEIHQVDQASETKALSARMEKHGL